jgi:hypothetical protein
MIYIDDAQSDSADGLLRCGHLVYTDEQGEERIHNDLLDSSGFFCREELIQEVIGLLGVPKEAVWLIE